MLTGRSVVCISSIDWDFIWQGHQQIMSTLAAHGNRVLFVENTGVRRPTLRDMPRLRQRLRNWWRGTKGFRQERDEPVRLLAARAAVPVFPGRPLDQPASCSCARIRRWMDVTGVQRPLVVDVSADRAGARSDQGRRPRAGGVLLHRRLRRELVRCPQHPFTEACACSARPIWSSSRRRGFASARRRFRESGRTCFPSPCDFP